MTNLIKNIFLILGGIVIIMPAILFGWIIKLIPLNISSDSPWTDGLILNILKAYQRYDAKSWIRRLILVFHYPILTYQYILILKTKEQITTGKLQMMNIDYLIPQHDVQTTHLHHRQRVDLASKGLILNSFSPIIIVDNVIHDGHHRVAAYKEAGIKEIECLVFHKIKIQ